MKKIQQQIQVKIIKQRKKIIPKLIMNIILWIFTKNILKVNWLVKVIYFKNYIINDKIKQDFFVVKIAKFSYTSKDHLNYLDEIYHHCQIEHPCISQLIGYSFTNFQNKECITLLMKYYQNSSLSNVSLLQ